MSSPKPTDSSSFNPSSPSVSSSPPEASVKREGQTDFGRDVVVVEHKEGGATNKVKVVDAEASYSKWFTQRCWGGVGGFMTGLVLGGPGGAIIGATAGAFYPDFVGSAPVMTEVDVLDVEEFDFINATPDAVNEPVSARSQIEDANLDVLISQKGSIMNILGIYDLSGRQLSRVAARLVKRETLYQDMEDVKNCVRSHKGYLADTAFLQHLKYLFTQVRHRLNSEQAADKKLVSLIVGSIDSMGKRITNNLNQQV